MNFLVLVLSVLCVSLAAAESTPDDQNAPAAAITWPPDYMKNLPPDYLARLLPALTQCLPVDGKWVKADDPVITVRQSIAALTLGQQMADANTFLERDDFVFPPNPDFGFALFSAAYVRLYGLFNDRTGVMKGRLSAKAQANLEKTLWDCAKKYSHIADAKRNVWDREGSENHHVTNKVSDFLVAQYLKDIPAYARERYDDGSAPRQQYDAWLAYWSKWLDEHARCGLFDEDGSSYLNYTMEALFNLRDFAEDPTLRRKADMFLDLAYANTAEETLRTQRGGPKTRTKEDHFRSRDYDLLFGAPGDKFDLAHHLLPTSNFYPSPAVVSLAKDIVMRGDYGFAKRVPDATAPGTIEAGTQWSRIDDTYTMLRVGFATPHYVLGSHALDTKAKVEIGREQRWQGIVFANDPMARIGMDGKNGVTKGGYVSNPFQTIQDRNVMVTLPWGPYVDEGTDRHLYIYFSHALESVEEADGWIFAKSGDAYAAIKIVDGGYKWTLPWKHSDAFSPVERSFVIVDSEKSPIITVVNDASDYGGDFAAFQAAVKAQPIEWKNGKLKFATITHEGNGKPGKIADRPVDLQPPFVNNSPFIRSAWNTGIVYICKGNETVKLDFSNPRNPVRTLGAPAVAPFPLGVGNAKPITFPYASLKGNRTR